MQAKETKLQDIIEGTKQYVIPLFQRTYSWTDREWANLWQDLIDLCEMENPKTHFIGSIVSMPTVSVPEGVAKYLLIDGQQRLTTIFIILALLRDAACAAHNTEFAQEINNTLLVNPYKKDRDYYKLMPTQIDREVYFNLIKPNDGDANHNEGDTNSKIAQAYKFFNDKLSHIKIPNDKLNNHQLKLVGLGYALEVLIRVA